jgi:hypothetical protein
LALVCAAGLSLMACTDGYPPSDAPVMDPERLTQSERIRAMNVLGEEAHPDVRWGYELRPGCRLQVSTRHVEGAHSSFELALGNLGMRTPFDKVDDVYLVQLVVASQVASTILSSVDWVDSVLMRGLVQAVQSSCRTHTPTSSAPVERR